MTDDKLRDEWDNLANSLFNEAGGFGGHAGLTAGPMGQRNLQTGIELLLIREVARLRIELDEIRGNNAETKEKA
jgi:hypothetical protein